MCTCTRSIINPTRRYIEGSTKLFLEVPCGKCDECRQRQRDEWSIRLFNEVDKYNKSSYSYNYVHKRSGISVSRVSYGRVPFVTLTYNNEHLPFISLPDSKTGKMIKIPSFSSEDKTRFLQLFKNRFRKFIDTDSFPDQLTFKFFFACEFGENKDGFARCTYRPHYHVLLFLPAHFMSVIKSDAQLKQIIRECWVDEEGFPLGFVYFSKLENGGLYVDSHHGSLYASKYINKDVTFFDQPIIKSYLYDKDGKIIKDNFDRIKEFLPRHWQSNGIGIGLKEIYDNLEAFENGVDFNVHTESGKVKRFPIPRYIERALLYDQQKDGTYLLNDKGRKFKEHKFRDTFDDMCTRFSRYLTVDAKNDFSLLPDNQLDFNGFVFHSYTDIYQHIMRILSAKSINEFILYLTCWRGYFIAKDTLDEEINFILPQLSYEDFYKLSLERKHLSFVEIEPTVYNPDGVFKSEYEDSVGISHLKNSLFHKEIEHYTFYNNPRFDGFEEILAIINLLKSNHRRLIQKNFHDNEKLKRKVKNFISGANNYVDVLDDDEDTLFIV